jgi:hypothetical protein
MNATGIDEVIAQLDDLITIARREKNRSGFFAATYRRVTVKVKEGIALGRFEDGARMERLDVIFANRYLDALRRFRQNQPTSRCWLVAFQAASRWRPLILQHLLLGINAHVNFDLGIAAAQTVSAAELPNLKRDFDEMNNILSELLDEVQEKIETVSPWLGLLDRIGGRTDEVIIKFSLKKARAAAWRVAQRLASLSPEQQKAEVDKLDEDVETLAYRLVSNPGVFISLVLWVIRLAESHDVAKVIDTLMRNT